MGARRVTDTMLERRGYRSLVRERDDPHESLDPIF